MALKGVLVYMPRNWIPSGLIVGPGRNTTHETGNIVTPRPQGKRHCASHQPVHATYCDP